MAHRSSIGPDLRFDQEVTDIDQRLRRVTVFSRDVMAALNKGTVAMLVSPTNPLGIKVYSYANVFFCFD